MTDLLALDLRFLTLAQQDENGPPLETQDLRPQEPNGEAGEVQQNGQPPQDTAPDDGGGGGGMFWILILLMVVMFWIFIINGPRKERKRHQQMLEAMKKNDKVRTAGGILGTVVEIRDDEIILKVDENSNTRLRVAKSAIQGVESSEQ